MVLVRAQPIPPRPPEPPDYEEEIYDRPLSEERQRGMKELEERAAEVGRDLGIRPEVRLLMGDEAAAILAASEEDASTLVAVGSRGLGPIRRERLGSVSTKVLRTARGPVLVCPPPLKVA